MSITGNQLQARRPLAGLALAALLSPLSPPPAAAGIYHYPWCETIRARCYAKAVVRKAECNWRYDSAKRHQLNGLSKWPIGTANYCFVYSQSHPDAALPAALTPLP